MDDPGKRDADRPQRKGAPAAPIDDVPKPVSTTLSAKHHTEHATVSSKPQALGVQSSVNNEPTAKRITEPGKPSEVQGNRGKSGSATPSAAAPAVRDTSVPQLTPTRGVSVGNSGGSPPAGIASPSPAVAATTKTPPSGTKK